MSFTFPPSSSFSQSVLRGVPEGLIPFILAKALSECTQPILHICRDENRLLLLEEQLRSLVPSDNLLIFPGWDCLPYDRVSPKKDIVGKRLETLTRLLNSRHRPLCVLTTPLAFLQRLMPKSVLEGACFEVIKGTPFSFEAFLRYTHNYGYRRVETVREPGEYAVRGSLVDLFPTQSETPFRIDLLGDMVESLRVFDELTQRSLDFLEHISLYPAEEVILTEETVKNFREAYRKIAGGSLENDALYQALSIGKPFTGMDHWLPLFYSHCSDLTDYFTSPWLLSLEQQVQQALSSTLTEINDYYQSRKRATHKWGEPAYNPVPVEMFYKKASEIEELFGKVAWQEYSPYCQGDELSPFKTTLDFTSIRQQSKINLIEAVIERLKSNPKPHIIACTSDGSVDRLKSLITEHGWPHVATFNNLPEAFTKLPRLGLVTFPLDKGFEGESLVVWSEEDIFGPKNRRPRKRRRRADIFLQETSTLTPGDLVVHSQHGIGRYEGLQTLTIEHIPHDCVCLRYEGGDKLYVPVENLDLLSRYSGEGSQGTLDKLGSAHWQARRARVKKRLMDIADHLIRLAAERHLSKAASFNWDVSRYDEFSASFPYTETDDQLQAIEETLEDLQKGSPMDRLICGDVGFGKTEVAMRAAFATALAGYQVAIIAPTTLLSRQHFFSFQKRFHPFGMRVAHLSRLVSSKEATLAKAAIEAGQVNVVIGTHGLLRGNTKFKKLGLVIIDEEQHFGVKQKEKLKELYPYLHLLTLSATPIPRTLQMALSGVRDLSLITTPPIDRLAVRTYIMPFDGLTVREAIMREIYRGGQIFVVCPHIEDLAEMEKRLQVLVPETRRVTVHGQMPANDIEETMIAFCDHAFDLMLSTNIIESGLDLPKVNTILVHKADFFGLAQLYQLRGRVGRAKVRGYAYMTFDSQKKLTPTAEKRLEVIQGLDTLGAGFQIASHDMDIRGAGNLLGAEQSGHIKEIGAELYQQMLEEALEAVRSEGNNISPPPSSFMPSINLNIPVLIPVDYIHDLSVRLDLYKRLSGVSSYEELLDMKAEIIDRFGPLPPECQNLIDILDLKILCKSAFVEKIDVGPRGAMLSFYQHSFPNPSALINFLQASKGSLNLKPDHRLSFIRVWKDSDDQKRGLKTLLQDLINLIPSTPLNR